ncbi:hypothetical protein DFP97_109215 [Paenibacillus prosopidis]|uniref:Uncharacterized protein n=1 Tax=Paenibacillus prosopidis TaxID=630520 RepID=A0A368W1N6_9BACL|nr:hypothetical protein DFP97_109215 [Paenibacillus prosopidis]
MLRRCRLGETIRNRLENKHFSVKLCKHVLLVKEGMLFFDIISHNSTQKY